ncbi:MAG: hypothetical protein JW839_17630 [Candidatus Lokiarchaeota archaeon]|nr:hypothetical protein [Candidatus Lokiarchaeota archaeon]
MATKPPKLSLKDIDPKILVQKVVAILVIQGIIYWIFTLVDPGFTESLMIYFWFVAGGSMVIIAWVHVHNALEDARLKSAGVLDQTDYAGD